jgi:hypothetical protein
MPLDHITAADAVSSGLTARPTASDAASFGGVFHVECRDRDGRLRWSEEVPNLVTAVGKRHVLDVAIRAQAQTAAWYMGLKDNAATPTQTQTLAAKGGWAEITAYSQATRPAYAPAAAANNGSSPNVTATVSNNAGPAAFTFNAQATVGGFFIASTNDKGGTTGTLLSIADFTNARTLYTDDTLSVRYDLTI